MQAIRMRRTYAAVTAESIAAVERRTGCPLHPDYRAFLEHQNGGLPEDSLFVSEDEEIAVSFLGIGLPPEVDYDDVLATWDRFGDSMPEGFLPIGRDPGGCVILLGTAPGREGQVFLWDNREAWADPDDPDNNVRRIAGSLPELLAHLQNEPEDDW